MLGKKVECRPLWKPMHKQPVYINASVYTNNIEVELFKVGFCLPAGPYVTDDDVQYIVESIKEASFSNFITLGFRIRIYSIKNKIEYSITF